MGVRVKGSRTWKVRQFCREQNWTMSHSDIDHEGVEYMDVRNNGWRQSAKGTFISYLIKMEIKIRFVK